MVRTQSRASFHTTESIVLTIGSCGAAHAGSGPLKQTNSKQSNRVRCPAWYLWTARDTIAVLYTCANATALPTVMCRCANSLKISQEKTLHLLVPSLTGSYCNDLTFARSLHLCYILRLHHSYQDWQREMPFEHHRKRRWSSSLGVIVLQKSGRVGVFFFAIELFPTFWWWRCEIRHHGHTVFVLRDLARGQWHTHVEKLNLSSLTVNLSQSRSL